MLRASLKFARPRIIITCFAIATLGSAAAGRVTPAVLWCFLLIIAFIIHANSINDYTDLEIDRVNLKNAKDRPLVTGDITIPQFWLVHGLSGGAMLLLSVPFGWRGVAASAVVVVIDYLYSLRPIRVADRPYATPLALAGTYVYYSFSLGLWSAHTHAAYPWMLSVALFLAFLARLLLKDFRDKKGDKRYGKETFLLRHGSTTTCVVSGLLWVCAVGSTFLARAPWPTIVVLIVGTVMVGLWLKRLSGLADVQDQQRMVTAIANAANIAIVALLVGYVCRDIGASQLASSVSVLVIGAGALGYNWFRTRHITQARRPVDHSRVPST
ncbi:MAG: UbiA prenyltransferase [Patescibacteria group bacterium]|nr:UbiA prenyltransferase [Patescibacteria group bacterium]